MTLAYLFGALFFVFFLLFLYHLDLILFFYREKKRFEKSEKMGDYISYAEKKLKKTKHPQKKNLFRYLLYLTFLSQGKENKAASLFPFLRSDPLLGIKKGG